MDMHATSLESTHNKLDIGYVSRLARICNDVYDGQDKDLHQLCKTHGYRLTTRKTTWQSVALLQSDKEIIVAFEGSPPYAFNQSHKHLLKYMGNSNLRTIEHPLGGRVHKGFQKRMDAKCDTDEQPLIESIHRCLQTACAKHPNARLVFTGHSAGGAAALLQSARFIADEALASRHARIITFGQPKIGNAAFHSALDAQLPQGHHRFVFPYDLVTQMPPSMGGTYAHGGEAHVLPSTHKEKWLDFDRSHTIHAYARALRKLDEKEKKGRLHEADARIAVEHSDALTSAVKLTNAFMLFMELDGADKVSKKYGKRLAELCTHWHLNPERSTQVAVNLASAIGERIPDSLRDTDQAKLLQEATANVLRLRDPNGALLSAHILNAEGPGELGL